MMDCGIYGVVKDCFKENNLKVVFDEVDCPTGSASILVDSNSQNEIIIFEGANGNKEPSYKRNKELLKGFDIIVLQNEIPQEINDWIINTFHKTHTIIYNPAPSRKVDVDVVSKVSYLTPNEVEICDITGLNESQSIDYLIEKGVQNLIITVGKDGVKYINKENKFSDLKILIKTLKLLQLIVNLMLILMLLMLMDRLKQLQLYLRLTLPPNCLMMNYCLVEK